MAMSYEFTLRIRALFPAEAPKVLQVITQHASQIR